MQIDDLPFLAQKYQNKRVKEINTDGGTGKSSRLEQLLYKDMKIITDFIKFVEDEQNRRHTK